MNSVSNKARRRALAVLLVAVGWTASGTAQAEELRFPGEEPSHKVVYQFNKAEPEYHNAVLFSVGAMLRKYGDDIKIVVTAIGPGIHILAKLLDLHGQVGDFCLELRVKINLQTYPEQP